MHIQIIIADLKTECRGQQLQTENLCGQECSIRRTCQRCECLYSSSIVTLRNGQLVNAFLLAALADNFHQVLDSLGDLGSSTDVKVVVVQ